MFLCETKNSYSVASLEEPFEAPVFVSVCMCTYEGMWAFHVFFDPANLVFFGSMEQITA